MPPAAAVWPAERPDRPNVGDVMTVIKPPERMRGIIIAACWAVITLSGCGSSSPVAAPSSAQSQSTTSSSRVPVTGGPSGFGPGRETCQVQAENGGTYFLLITSRRDNDLSECDGGTPLQANIDTLLGDTRLGPNMDRRCIYDITTDPTVDALVGVYSSGREIDRAAAREICELHHGTMRSEN
jgi:hypothetical protein